MKKLQNKKGFTLVEMIVVLAIIAILIALLAPNVARLIKNAQTTSDNAKAKTVMNTAQAYATDAVADGNNIISGSVQAIGTKAYFILIDETSGNTNMKNAFYPSTYTGTPPAFLDGSGDAYLPKNTVKGDDAVAVYFSLEGAVMGTVFYQGTGATARIKAVSGVCPEDANSAGTEFTTGKFRGGTFNTGTGSVTAAP